jgi:DNA-directed RNA polymerase specialized sigma24 family protein
VIETGAIPVYVVHRERLRTPVLCGVRDAVTGELDFPDLPHYPRFQQQKRCDQRRNAEDLTAETLRRITLAVNRFNYRTGYQFKAWLFAIARNVGIDYMRHAPPECALPDYLQDIAAVLLEPAAEAEVVAAVHEAIAQSAPRLSSGH